MFLSRRKEAAMILLHIEHSVANFENWKASFDGFAELRVKSGVHKYRISRSIDDPSHVAIDLEIETLEGAKSLLGAVQQVWQRVSGTLIHDPQWRLAEIVEQVALQRSGASS
jgi:hypothetical protein